MKSRIGFYYFWVMGLAWVCGVQILWDKLPATSWTLFANAVASVPRWERTPFLSQHVQQYLKQQKNFKDKLCSPGTQNRFRDLYRHYRGEGFFIPFLENDQIDVMAIKDGLADLRLKKNWIDQQLESLQDKKFKKLTGKELLGREQLRDVHLLIGQIRGLIKLLLQDKEAYVDTSELQKKKLIKLRSKQNLQVLHTQYEQLLSKIPFFLNYKFPIDLLMMRKNYEDHKKIKTSLGHHLRNKLYFLRSLVEDGAQNPDHSQSDDSLRALLSTLAMRLKENRFFLSEGMRYDLGAMMHMLEKQLSHGKVNLRKRMGEWKDRTDKAVTFFELIAENYSAGMGVEGASKAFNNKTVEEIILARKELREFVYQKHRETIEFWKEHDEKLLALFVLETILYNEVGRIDPTGVERKEIIQVVLNRLRPQQQKYIHLEQNDPLFTYFQLLSHKDKERSHWWRVLFKQGEFSFTYFFIPSVVRIFCPDGSKIGENLRQENLLLALDMLQATQRGSSALRYFSRHSMLGRIDMAKVWIDFKPLPQLVGLPMEKQKKQQILRLKKEKKYNYLYSFRDKGQQHYKVMEFYFPQGPLTAVIGHDQGEDSVYTYRNPHFFRYFTSL